MFKRALQGYEKAWGPEHTSTLNTISNLGLLFEGQTDIAKARMMYSKALVGCEKVFGPDHPRSQGLRDNLRALDAVVENKALIGVEESINNLQGGPSHLVAEGTPLKSKRRKLF